MGIRVFNPATEKYAEAKDQAQFDRIFKSAGWVKADPSADGVSSGELAAQYAELKARMAALEAQFGAIMRSLTDAASEDGADDPLFRLAAALDFDEETSDDSDGNDEETSEGTVADAAEDAAPATRRRSRKAGEG